MEQLLRITHVSDDSSVVMDRAGPAISEGSSLLTWWATGSQTTTWRTEPASKQQGNARKNCIWDPERLYRRQGGTLSRPLHQVVRATS